MCTVSVVPIAGGCRLSCNRDEARARARALPPGAAVVDGRRALFPVDPVSRGTWVGLNDAGLVLALLNRSRPGPPAFRPRRSRGTIIPPLLAFGRLDMALDAAISLTARHFEPFRLVMLQGSRIGVVASDGARLRVRLAAVREPLLWTSSSLGDAVVERPRSDLFAQMVIGARDGWARGQRRFHQHRWTQHPEISVVMSRAEAQTVSRTTIDLATPRYTLSYEPFDGAPAIVVDSLARAA